MTERERSDFMATSTAAPVPFVALIPARMASSRLPGKPLADIGGLPMVIRVAHRAHASGASRVVIATDEPAVAAAAARHSVECVMTRADHPSGTDRLAEAADLLGLSDDQTVVNVQGDEPLIDPELVAQTAQQLADSGADIATVAHPISDPADFFAPNVVKVVCRANGDALYFSRATIPFPRDHFASAAGRESLPSDFPACRHIGLYAYRASFLRAYARLAPSPLEGFEALEQLRALWHGFRISVVVSDHLPMPGVDTPGDAERMKEWFRTH